VEITPPIMSRFDLFFVVLDQGNDVTDYNIARHILEVHRELAKGVDVQSKKEQVKRPPPFPPVLNGHESSCTPY